MIVWDSGICSCIRRILRRIRRILRRIRTIGTRISFIFLIIGRLGLWLRRCDRTDDLVPDHCVVSLTIKWVVIAGARVKAHDFFVYQISADWIRIDKERDSLVITSRFVGTPVTYLSTYAISLVDGFMIVEFV